MSTQLADLTSLADLAGMEQWTGAMAGLLHRAAQRATDATLQVRLEAACEDAEAIRAALQSALDGSVSAERRDSLESVYLLWEANQGRNEQLAAEADAEGYERWRRSSSMIRVRRRGSHPTDTLSLPYS
jgi:hypothetical protein